MIRVRLIGRFGNQMFQYAFAYLMAKKFSTFFVLDGRHYAFDLKYFDLPFPHRLLQNTFFWRLYNFFQSRLKFKSIVYNQDCTQSFDTIPLQNNTDYIGYFQDGDIYNSSKENIRRLFTIKKKYTNAFNAKYGALMAGQRLLVISVRLGDYRRYKLKEYDNAEILLPMEWYVTQIQSLPYEQFKVFVISDEIDTVQKEFEASGFLFHYVKDTVINQFLLLQHADVAIIPNSTFAWWASFLNVKKDPLIIAPKYFLGYWVKKEFPLGIQKVNFDWR